MTPDIRPPLPPGNPEGAIVYDQLKRHQIEVLRSAGFSLREVARKSEVSLDTVQRVLHGSPQADGAQRPVGRPPLAIAFEEKVRTFLRERYDLPTVEVLRRLRREGYSGGKNPVYQLVRRLRQVIPPPMVRFEGLPGEFSQNDFGHVRVRYDDAPQEILHFFASRLKWSRHIFVEIVPNEQVESLVRALLRALEAFGGVPLVCVFDNPKTVVISRHGDQIQWNSTFAQVANDFRFGPELCTPRRGQEKGAVENLVGFVKNGFFKARRFHDRADLDDQLVDWHHEVNEVRPCRATGVTPLARMEEERARLRPLPFRPSEYPLRFPVRVGPTGWVLFRGVRYSMPAEVIGVTATLFLYPDRVRIMTDRYDVAHPRDPPHGVSTLAKHATSALAAVSGRRAQTYYKRQRLLETGPSAEEFLTGVVHARPNTWNWDVHRLFDLWLEYGPDRMAAAFHEAVERGWNGAEMVELWLRTKVEGVA
jgi:transposase